MARVLYSVFSNLYQIVPGKLDMFFQNISNALLENGNDVFQLVVNEIPGYPKENKKVEAEVVEKIKAFKPDLILSPNHDIPLSVLNGTDCPIIAYTADSPAYFKNREYIKTHPERYFFMHGGWDNIFPQLIKEDFDIPLDRNFFTGHMTAVRARKMPIKRNIGFIGFVGWPQPGVDNLLATRLLESGNQEAFDKLIREYENLDIRSPEYCQIKTANIRAQVLDAISDLGLECFGIPNNFIRVAAASWNVVKCFKFRPVLTLQDTEEVLNSSLISPNLYNWQAPIGLSWRVADVMASNACLISPPKPDLKKLSPYVEIPTYESPAECRELCQKLLKDEAWRKDIVKGCQRAINEKCRPVHLLKKISKHLGINLINRGEAAAEHLNIIYKYSQKVAAGTPVAASTSVKVSAPKCVIKRNGYPKNPFKRLPLKLYYKVWKHFKKKLLENGVLEIPESSTDVLVKTSDAEHLFKRKRIRLCYKIWKHCNKTLMNKKVLSVSLIVPPVQPKPVSPVQPKPILPAPQFLSVPWKMPRQSFDRMICLSGFGFSGSGAVADILSEFNNVTVCSYADPDGSLRKNTAENSLEIDLLRHAGGLFSLEQAFTTRNIFLRDVALKRFIEFCEFLFANIKGVYNDEFMRLSMEFAESLVMFKFPGRGFELALHTENRGVMYPLTYGNLMYPFVGLPNKQRYIYYLKDLDVHQFRSLAKKYLKQFLRLVPSKSCLLMDQITGDLCCDIERYQEYLGPVKSIAVYRDPRDVYATIFNHNAGFIPRDVNEFCEWYRYNLSPYFTCKHPDFLLMKFEDLVLKYNESLRKICKFANLNINSHTDKYKAFSPEISSKNILLYKKFPDQWQISEIERNLKEFCYYPEKENISKRSFRLLNEEKKNG